MSYDNTRRMPTGDERDDRLNQADQFNRDNYGRLRDGHRRLLSDSRHNGKDDLNIPDTDGKRATQHVQGKISHQMYDQCEKVIHNRRFPYRSMSELIRAALHYHLAAMSELPDGENLLTTRAVMEAMQGVVRETEYLRDMESHVGTIEAQVKAMIEAGDAPAARVQTAKMVARLEQGDLRHYKWAPRFREAFREINEQLGRA